MRVAFVHNRATHYTVGLFERLAKRYEVDFYFFSRGEEWYWLPEHEVSHGEFRHDYLKGFSLLSTRVTPSLIPRLLRGRYDVFIKCINGRFALPVTYGIAKALRKPFILWTGIWCRLRRPVHAVTWPATLHIYRNANAIVSYGEHVKEYLRGEGVDPEKVFVAPHAVDNAFYRSTVAQSEQDLAWNVLAVPGMRKVVLFVGRLERIKGLDVLLDAFKRMDRQDTILVIVGRGSQSAWLEQRISEWNLRDRVKLVGFVPTRDLPRYYSIASVVVLPSISTDTGRETWGLVVNEAFNQGVPVIASTAVGAAAGGLVQSGENGLVVPEGDPVELQMAMEKVLMDDERRALLSLGAREAISKWDHDAMAEGFAAAIDFASRRKR